MNTFAHRPMPFSAKMRALYRGRYVLDRGHNLPDSRDERELVSFVDQHGAWLD